MIPFAEVLRQLSNIHIALGTEIGRPRLLARFEVLFPLGRPMPGPPSDVGSELHVNERVKRLYPTATHTRVDRIQPNEGDGSGWVTIGVYGYRWPTTAELRAVQEWNEKIGRQIDSVRFDGSA